MEINRRKMCTVLLLGVPTFLVGCSSRENMSEPRIVPLGPISDFREGDNILTLNRILLRRKGNELSALSLVCTHQNCLVKPVLRSTTAEGFDCPCHGSHFSATGTPEIGPAKTNLPWLKLGLKEGIIELYPEESVPPTWTLKI